MWDTYICKSNCYSLRLPPGWRSVKMLWVLVRKLAGEGDGENGERGKTLNVFFGEGGGEELECLEGQKL